jgi:tubby-related protein 1
MPANNILKGVTVLVNQEPQWNESMGCYTLNFYERVKLASKKNYQMIRPGDDSTIFFQFGKVL